MQFPPDETEITYSGLILMQNLVILRHGNTEDDSSYILKAMNPFFALRSLATNIKQPKRTLFFY